MNPELEEQTPQSQEQAQEKMEKSCRHGILIRILGPMPRWLYLWFQIGAFATLTLLSLTFVMGLIAAIITGDYNAVANMIKAFVPDSLLGGL